MATPYLLEEDPFNYFTYFFTHPDHPGNLLVRIYDIYPYRYYENLRNENFIRLVYGGPEWYLWLQNRWVKLEPRHGHLLELMYGLYPRFTRPEQNVNYRESFQSNITRSQGGTPTGTTSTIISQTGTTSTIITPTGTTSTIIPPTVTTSTIIPPTGATSTKIQPTGTPPTTIRSNGNPESSQGYYGRPQERLESVVADFDPLSSGNEENIPNTRLKGNPANQNTEAKPNTSSTGNTATSRASCGTTQRVELGYNDFGPLTTQNTETEPNLSSSGNPTAAAQAPKIVELALEEFDPLINRDAQTKPNLHRINNTNIVNTPSVPSQNSADVRKPNVLPANSDDPPSKTQSVSLDKDSNKIRDGKGVVGRPNGSKLPVKDFIAKTSSERRQSEEIITKTNGVVLATRSDPLLNVPEAQKDSHTCVIECLRRIYMDKYKEKSQYILNFPAQWDLATIPSKILFDLQLISTKDNPGKAKNKNNLTSIVIGNPGFGKSTLCAILAHHWAVSSFDVSRFKLCFQFHLKDLQADMDISERILEEVLNDLVQDQSRRSCPSISEKTVFDALSVISKDIFIVLDGFDEMTRSGKDEVSTFLRKKSVFQYSKVIITTRPVADTSFTSFIDLFDEVFRIGGFSTECLSKILKNLRTTKETLDETLELFQNERKLSHLFVFPPAFLVHCTRLIYSGNFNREDGCYLFGILDRVFLFIARHSYHKADVAENDTPVFYVRLGKLFFEALVRRHFTFTENVLKTALGDGFKFILNCHIFHEDRIQLSSVKLWTVSDKLLMVFFATKYLRHVWSTFVAENQRERFLKKVFCYTCAGDYITGETGTLYMVGVLPEIVLKFGNQFSTEKATFEMYYDVERVELSHAFDSVNLLTRIGVRHYKAFGFIELDLAERDLPPVFEDLISYASFQELLTDYSTYENVHEDKLFLEVVSSEGDNKQEAVYAVFRTTREDVVDKIYIDFTFTILDNVFHFVKKVLSGFLPGFELHDGCRFSDFGSFVFQLVIAVALNKLTKPVLISCGGELAKGTCDPRRNVIIKVHEPSEGSENMVLVSVRQLVKGSLSCSKRSFTATEVWSYRSTIQSLVQQCYTCNSQARICIDML